MTERFDGLAQQTIYGASGVGPAEPVTSLTAIGVGQGSGTTANAQEANSMIAFEFPIRWDDISGALANLTDKKKLDQLVDDLTVRDNILEDYLNTNIVSGIVAGSNVSIDRATGVVTISAGTPAWTTFSPVVKNLGGTTGTVSNNASAYVQIGKTVHVRLLARITFGTNSTVETFGLPVAPKVLNALGVSMGTFFAIEMVGMTRFWGNLVGPSDATARITFYPSVTTSSTTWDVGATITYEAA